MPDFKVGFLIYYNSLLRKRFSLEKNLKTYFFQYFSKLNQRADVIPTYRFQTCTFCKF